MEAILPDELLEYVIKSVEERNPMINISFWKGPSNRKVSKVSRQLRYWEGSCCADEVCNSGRL